MHFPLLAIDFNICNLCFCLCFGSFLFAVTSASHHGRFYRSRSASSNPGYTRGYFFDILRSDFKIIYVNFISFSLCPLSLVLFSISWRRLAFCSCSCLLVSWVWSQELLSRGCTPGVDQVRCWSTSAAHLAHLSGSVKCWAEHCLWGFSHVVNAAFAQCCTEISR